MEDMSDRLPQKAAPIVKEMLALLERGEGKLSKYDARGKMEAMFRAKSEQVRSTGANALLLFVLQV
jgi:hypothetical protein